MIFYAIAAPSGQVTGIGSCPDTAAFVLQTPPAGGTHTVIPLALLGDLRSNPAGWKVAEGALVPADLAG